MGGSSANKPDLCRICKIIPVSYSFSIKYFSPFFISNLILRLALFPSQPPGLCMLSVIHKRRALNQIENAAQAVSLEQCHINNRGRKNKMNKKDRKKGNFISPLWKIGIKIYF